MSRPPIPSDMKRLVRQKCGFGCVICRVPLYDYEHVDPYNIVQEHTLENLVLMCPNCHRKKGKGFITKERINYCLKKVERAGYTDPDDLQVEYYSLRIGSNVIHSVHGFIFDIEGYGRLAIVHKGMPLINGYICDSNGGKVIVIEDNNYSLSCESWDVEYVGKRLRFRSAPGEIFCEIKIDVIKKEIEVNGFFRLDDDTKINITKGGIYANKNLLAKDNMIMESKAGIVVTSTPPNMSVAFPGGQTKGNMCHGYEGIAFGNTCNSTGNVAARCNIGFLWTPNFLAHLAKAEQAPREREYS